MKKIISISMAAIICTFCLIGCSKQNGVSANSNTQPEPIECAHAWVNATCTSPATCSICGETAGDPIGHRWTDANCTTAKTCSICGEVDGEPLGHTWVAATYDSPKTCSVCGRTEGKPLTRPVQTQPPIQQTPTPTRKTCLICGYTVTRSDTQYCSTHDCARSGCPYPAKHLPGSYGSFCEFHSCSDLKCARERTNDSNYCSAHKH